MHSEVQLYTTKWKVQPYVWHISTLIQYKDTENVWKTFFFITILKKFHEACKIPK